MATAIDEADTTARVETLRSGAPLFRLNKHASVDVLGEVLASTSRWSEVAVRRNIPKVEIDKMAAFEHNEAFEHTEREAARALTDA